MEISRYLVDRDWLIRLLGIPDVGKFSTQIICEIKAIGTPPQTVIVVTIDDADGTEILRKLIKDGRSVPKDIIDRVEEPFLGVTFAGHKPLRDIPGDQERIDVSLATLLDERPECCDLLVAASQV